MPPGQLVAGESMKSLLLLPSTDTETNEHSSGTKAVEHSGAMHGAVQARKKHWALSQWPRRPSCTTKPNCIDGHGDPFAPEDDQVSTAVACVYSEHSSSMHL
jgi:hypothetical protein